MPRDVLNWLRHWDEHRGRLALIASLAALWLTIMTITWMVPNENTVAVRLALTAYMSLLCGAFIWRTCIEERKAVRAHRLKTGLCLRCGYDLRSTPGRCPECGSEATI